jgi:acyl dehydratase
MDGRGQICARFRWCSWGYRVIGKRHCSLAASRLTQYAQATQDVSARVQAGAAAPATAIVTQVWHAQEAGRRALVSEELAASAAGGVHGEHDIVLHRPIRPGEPLRTWAEGHGARPAGRNAAVTVRYATFDERGELVAEQWWTTVYLKAACELAGTAAPAHAFPEEARDRVVGEYTVRVDDDLPRRYAEVSADWSPHHFDDEVAQREGFPRRFLHGLCTLGLCAQGAVSAVAGGDPDRVRRIAVRFAAPALVPGDVSLSVHEAGHGLYAFEARGGGQLVIRDGLLELRP